MPFRILITQILLSIGAVSSMGSEIAALDFDF